MLVAQAIKKRWKLIAIWLLLIIPLINFGLIVLSILFVIYWPNDFNAIDFSQFDNLNQAHLVVLAHGVNDDPSGWTTQMSNTIATNSGQDALVVGLDWSRYANDPMRCAVYGKRIGQRIGEIASTDPNLKTAHLIGHSCGAFIAYGICQSLKDRNSNIMIQTTYLDPVAIYTVFWRYGLDRFGSCADYSEAYIDTEDGVPGSNELLPHTHTYDVTAVRKQSSSLTSPHVWPTEYYQQLVTEGVAPYFWKTPSLVRQKPAGILEVVE